MGTLGFVQVFFGRPWLAFMVAGIFLALGYILLFRDELHRGFFVGATGFVWVFYGLYEYMLVTTFHISPGFDSFRFDMVFVFPLLAILTLISLWFTCSELRGSLL